MGIEYDDKAIETLLDRSRVGETKDEENLLANEYLGQFKVTKLADSSFNNNFIRWLVML